MADIIYTCPACGYQEVRERGGFYTANVPTHCNFVMQAVEVSQATPEEKKRVYDLFLKKLAEKHPEHPWIRKENDAQTPSS